MLKGRIVFRVCIPVLPGITKRSYPLRIAWSHVRLILNREVIKMGKSVLSKIFSALIALCSGALMLACGGAIDQSRVNASVSKTANPLVAQFTVSSGCIGEATVEFGPDTSYGRSTNAVPVIGAYKRSNILVAGMRASTTYHMRAQVTCLDNGQPISTPDTTFTTGPLPSSVPFPQMTVSRPSPSKSSPENPGVELVNIFAPGTAVVQTYVTDRDGNPHLVLRCGSPELCVHHKTSSQWTFDSHSSNN